MFFSNVLSYSTLIALSRALHHNLGAGIRIADVFAQQAARGPREARDVANRIHRRLARGNDLAAALKKETIFPALFVALATVGEKTGHLAEMFGAIEEYYQLQQQLQRKFRSQITGPAIQFVLAVLVITLVIFILGLLNSANGTHTSVLGLSGPGGALLFLGVIVGSGLAIYIVSRVLAGAAHGKALVDAALLRVPGIGPCLRVLALGRFTLAMHATLDTGMSILKAVDLSLQATGNAAFTAQSDTIVQELRAGEALTLALTGTGIFPDDFRNMLSIAEQSGRIPEMMARQSRHYQEEASRRLKALTTMAAWGVYLVYAGFMIVMIYQLARIYFDALKM
jgi:type IV pilus assembly protein PilC